jgi:oxygen-independent coproporphyrinogen III oxidase
MAGIYFHIPFCLKKCHYCDFYSRSDPNGIDEIIQAEIQELILRKEYIGDEIVETIYFGGGTPSLLDVKHITLLLNCVKNIFDVSTDCEITFEANPDDLSEVYLADLYNCGINRLSIGIQSFNDDVLKFLGRRHDSKKLNYIIDIGKGIGFDNISIDLIFGIPGFDTSVYLASLKSAIQLNIQHISAYSLTIAEGTLFYKRFKNNKLSEINEDILVDQFNQTIDFLALNGFNHYEISNYAKDGFKSLHNSSYWDDVTYLGIGPSAHSYNQLSRQWNVSNSKQYCAKIKESKSFFEVEYLTPKDKFNEYLIIGLRTSNGISKKFVFDNFDDKICLHFSRELDKLFEQKLVCLVGENIVLTRKGILISDFILRNLYFV